MEKYYLGLDMGTSSVGWAVTDENYQLIRRKGKDLWGVRLFEEAETAADRRIQRVSRRRRQREQVRVGMLKDYFADAIMEVDPNFYTRLQNSKYHLDDKDAEVRTPNGIFADPDYTDKDYFRDYPTIFHLREELIKNPEPHDVRLVFLALLNMYKHRGHFLNAGASSDEIVKMDDALKNLYDLLDRILDLSLAEVEPTEAEAILSSREDSRTRKSEKLAELFGVTKKDKKEMLLLKMICGLKGDARSLFELNDLEEKIEVQFAAFGYEEKEAEIQAAVGDEFFEIISAMKTIYDIGSLAGILRGSNYLSEARVKDYDKHKKDLSILKRVIRKHCGRKEYDDLFRSESKGSYSAYVNSVSYDRLYKNGETSKHRRNMNGRSRDDFYSNVKRILRKLEKSGVADEDVSYIQNEIDLETFMPKQMTASNGVIPYQVHEREMKAILRNACKYLPFLNKTDESGMTVSERILVLFTFQIPYYIGPVTEKSAQNHGNGWVVRKEAGTVFPWNFDQKIDRKKTAEEFISRMVRRCTYLNDERVLPKSSLLYESYCVLNEINNIRVDGQRIAVELKQQIYNELFKKGKKVSRKKLVDYLSGRGRLSSENQLSGIDSTINNSLGSYGKFYAIFGEQIETDSGKKMAEDIIFWCTVYGDSKEFLTENIKEHYPEISESQIKRIRGIRFKDWGRFSREFLYLQGIDKDTGEVMSLIRALWETPYNLMELINSDQFTFKESLEEKISLSEEVLKDLKPEDLEQYYFSAPVRRMVWQTLRVIRELEELMGHAPEKVFVEMTRTDEEKGDRGRKDSRKKRLLDLYKNVKDETHNWKDFIEQSDRSGKLRSKKMYLYIAQMGKDMYTGEPIELDQLFDNNIYDIDHIYPRHFVKDDSIHNNLVLVNKSKNAHKSDNYPLETTIRNNEKVKGLWDALRKNGLITEEKYRRLTGKKEFSEEQKAGFIARQLVETGQATKGITDILKQVLPETEIVYAKASNVSDFRKKFHLLKSRLVNDFHHAHDAYLNIVVGNVYLTKFTKNPLKFIKKEYITGKTDYHLTNLFKWDVHRNGKTAWIAPRKGGDPGTIAVVKKTLARNTPLITKALVVRSGKLFDVNPNGKGKANDKNYIPLKSSDPKMGQLNKYGGYTSLKPAYLMLVEHGKKGKRKRSFESVPIHLKEKLVTEEQLLDYCKNECGLIDPSIRVRKIKLYSLLRMDGYYYRIAGLDSSKRIELHNAVPLCLKQEWINYIKTAENVVVHGGNPDNLSREENEELYDLLLDKHKNTIFNRKPKSSGSLLENGRNRFIEMDVEAQAQVLLKILDLSKLGTINVDMKILGGSSEEGRMRISGNITNKNSVFLINQSVTGVITGKPVDLLKV